MQNRFYQLVDTFTKPKSMKNKIIFIATILSVFYSKQMNAQTQHVEVFKIWNKAVNNSFTDLIRFKGKFYCTFREGSGHTPGKSGVDGSIRILSSGDGEKWIPVALLKKEEIAPSAFLTVTGNSRKNIVGQTVVRGTIVNKASVATFKDVNIELTFFSKTKALLETDKETIFQILNPGESQDFKTKYFAPKGTDSVGLRVLGAKAIPN